MKASFNHTEYLTYTGTIWGGPHDSPKNVAKGLYKEPLFDTKARFGLEQLYIGTRKNVLRPTETDSYYIANATLSSEDLVPGLDISFGVYNVFDSPWDMVAPWPTLVIDNIPMNGRSFMLTARTTF